MEVRFGDVVTEKTSIFDEFIGACLMSSTYAHSAHFMTKSYEKHIAYEYFYDNMPGLIDIFAESYMGSGFTYRPRLSIYNGTFESFVNQLAQMAEKVSASAPNTVLKNTSDDIQELCRMTMYKLSLH
ncbi:starvation-inducible transcriptional regulator [Aeromonas phage AS-gz]|jgi:hypothetical protein|uniref:Uncharacterized protein n=2 Tax=Tulanevirus TaxID=2560244 RepID=J7HXX6_9CAUD|nr:starvation-inducible transcriptional regulator [Stenotrophomonas phage IME13]YP_009613177.1 starvation-inducible transcriptional regulator [Aeromonas phage AS-gz]UYD57750.1 hypothetical protein MEIMHGIN_00108 [Aeromonas phage avDM3]UYD58004.1 hypothetical protein GHHBBDOD_00149 [Aeromonas phage avDM4]AFQ22597.1 hypothetical protein [Stenotrophomonas phage IME13]ASU00726.1 hypothetical protein [Aeromonas phage AS-gz]